MFAQPSRPFDNGGEYAKRFLEDDFIKALDESPTSIPEMYVGKVLNVVFDAQYSEDANSNFDDTITCSLTIETTFGELESEWDEEPNRWTLYLKTQGKALRLITGIAVFK